MVEVADTTDLKSVAFGRGGSIPSTGTKEEEFIWFGGRNHSLDYSGEYVPTSSWSYKKYFNKALYFPRYYGYAHYGYSGYAEICIAGKYKQGRLKPYRWYGNFHWGSSRSYDLDWRGSCNSIADALRKADKQFEEKKNQFLRKFYKGMGEKAIYKKEGDSWVPFLSDLGGAIDYYELDYGKYAVLSWYHHHPAGFCKLSRQELDRSYLGWGSGGTKDESVLNLEMWITDSCTHPRLNK